MRKETMHILLLISLGSFVVVSICMLVIFISAYPTGKVLVNFNRYNEYYIEFGLSIFYVILSSLTSVLFFKYIMEDKN